MSRARLVSLSCACLLACGDRTTDLTPRTGGAVSRPSDAAVADAAADASSPARCGKSACACNDGKDNDRDGLRDGQDPECTAAFDDNEATFATGKPPKRPNACEDCFWDDNTESDDDDCAYAESCRATGSPPAGPPGGAHGAEAMCSCEVTQRCADSCRPRTPNGCDCFGCCEVTRSDGSTTRVVLNPECSVASLSDPALCPPCVQNAACLNPCGACELCVGRGEVDLPAQCRGGSGSTPAHQCDEGYDACSDSTPCPPDYYCVLGCCVVAVL